MWLHACSCLALVVLPWLLPTLQPGLPPAHPAHSPRLPRRSSGYAVGRGTSPGPSPLLKHKRHSVTLALMPLLKAAAAVTELVTNGRPAAAPSPAPRVQRQLTSVSWVEEEAFGQLSGLTMKEGPASAIAVGAHATMAPPPPLGPPSTLVVGRRASAAGGRSASLSKAVMRIVSMQLIQGGKRPKDNERMKRSASTNNLK